MKKSNSTKKALGAVLILSPDHLNIKVAANTEDGSDITVEGCTETTLKSDIQNIASGYKGPEGGGDRGHGDP